MAMTLGGRSEAFATLVERYDRAVYHLAYRTLHDVEEARDARKKPFSKPIGRCAPSSRARSSRPGSLRSPITPAAIV